MQLQGGYGDSEDVHWPGRVEQVKGMLFCYILLHLPGKEWKRGAQFSFGFWVKGFLTLDLFNFYNNICLY